MLKVYDTQKIILYAWIHYAERMFILIVIYELIHEQ